MKFGRVHLFGEMELNLSLNPKSVYKKACNISENCGYVTTLEKGVKNRSRDRIEIFGEDCDDRLNIVSILYFENDKFDKVQKCIYFLGYDEGDNFKSWKQLRQVFELIDGNWIEIFNSKEVGVTMSKEYF